MFHIIVLLCYHVHMTLRGSQAKCVEPLMVLTLAEYFQALYKARPSCSGFADL